MKKYHLLIAMLFNLFMLNAQVAFEKGYFINEQNEKIDCFIKNLDRPNAPRSFTYKLTTDAPEEKGEMSEVKEFGMGEQIKFVRHEVLIDRSSNVATELKKKRGAEFEKETLFLKILVKGEGSLYFYQYKTFKRFFYQLGGNDLEQLVYKRYLAKTNRIATNNRFRQQLKVGLDCVDLSNTKNLDYTKKDLVKLFESYNKCKGKEYISYKPKKNNKGSFNLWLKTEAMYSSLGYSLSDKYYDRINKSDKSWNYQYGVSIEYILPVRNKKWSILLEPTYQTYSDEVERLYEFIEVTEKISIDITSLEVPLGIRYYMYFNKDAKLYFNVHYLMDWYSRFEVDFELHDKFTEDIVRGNFAFGAGYVYKRFGIEVRYKMGKDFLGAYGARKTDYKGPSALLSFRIF